MYMFPSEGSAELSRSLFNLYYRSWRRLLTYHKLTAYLYFVFSQWLSRLRDDFDGVKNDDLQEWPTATYFKLLKQKITTKFHLKQPLTCYPLLEQNTWIDILWSSVHGNSKKTIIMYYCMQRKQSTNSLQVYMGFWPAVHYFLCIHVV